MKRCVTPGLSSTALERFSSQLQGIETFSKDGSIRRVISISQSRLRSVVQVNNALVQRSITREVLSRLTATRRRSHQSALRPERGNALTQFMAGRCPFVSLSQFPTWSWNSPEFLGLLQHTLGPAHVLHADSCARISGKCYKFANAAQTAP